MVGGDSRRGQASIGMYVTESKGGKDRDSRPG